MFIGVNQCLIKFKNYFTDTELHGFTQIFWNFRPKPLVVGNKKWKTIPTPINDNRDEAATRSSPARWKILILFEKTKPISCFVFRMWYIVCRVLKKQSQFKLVPSSSSGQALREVKWTQLLRSAYKAV